MAAKDRHEEQPQLRNRKLKRNRRLAAMAAAESTAGK